MDAHRGGYACKAEERSERWTERHDGEDEEVFAVEVDVGAVIGHMTRPNYRRWGCGNRHRSSQVEGEFSP